MNSIETEDEFGNHSDFGRENESQSEIEKIPLPPDQLPSAPVVEPRAETEICSTA